ncbi:MAG: hypothetical protein HYT11_02365 [Candidatus Levybacteria bacterium]|nr:hypothetical protein [Candidatus Levybacteria bacterium]
MLHLINGKILLSGATIIAAAALVIGGTFAFFSDSETSTGNTFTAGAIDLQIDNTSYATDPETGLLAFSQGTSWELSDLTIQKFFNFTDLKPGDIGEDTISVHVNNNDAWLCAAARVTDNSDQTCTEPETADDPSCGTGNSSTNGDLADEVNFAFWKDDGDNVFENTQGVSGNAETLFLSGPISGLGAQGQIALSDSSNTGPFGNTPVPGGSTSNIGKAWCFGTLTPVTTANDANADPVTRGSTGFTCNGSGVDNAAQTDKVMGDLQFYATQSRNNDDFTCEEDYDPVWPTPTP